MHKRLFVILAAVALAFIPARAVFAGDIDVVIDGVLVDFANDRPAIVDNRTLVPVRAVFEALGFKVGWDAPTVTLSRTDYTIVLNIGSQNFTINGNTRNLDVAAQIIGGSTMLPIRALVESVGYYVDWLADRSMVVISTAPIGRGAIGGWANGIPISTDMINFELGQILQMLGMEDCENCADFYEDAVFGAAAQVLMENFAKNIGITVGPEVMSEISNHIDEIISAMGADEYNAALAASRIASRYHHAEIYYFDVLWNNLIAAILTNPAQVPRFGQYLLDDIVAAKHILLSFDDFDTPAAAEAFARVLITRANDGEIFADLIENYGADPGMIANPGGYTFTRGTMVQAFCDATRALNIGEISGIVPSNFGLHIIKRVEPNLGNVMTPPGWNLENLVLNMLFNAFMNDAENAKIIHLPMN
ncbi:MAG: stalk domain-containing protein [Defluviitaleaceae bacterium]|nr:stalk domain-containing protein [Defluviitaleaceae bacterium]